jgi:hypothetical protein
MTPAPRKSSKSGIGEALLALSRSPAIPLKTSPLHSSRAPSALRSPDQISPLDIPSHPITSDHPIATDHVNTSSHQSSAISDQSLAQPLELLLSQLALLVAAPKTRRAISTRVPDVFDGTDPQKLDNFIFQCSMYLVAHPDEFPDDETRVTFALSYLDNTPLDWFRTDIHSATESGTLPPWFTSYPVFIAELQRLFGPSDPTTNAMSSLENLRYDDASRATRYTLDFNYHACRTGWNDRALARQYYRGLPDRLKDELARIGKPSDIRALQELVCVLDQRYWERQSECCSSSLADFAPPSPASTSPSPPSPDSASPSPTSTTFAPDLAPTVLTPDSPTSSHSDSLPDLAPIPLDTSDETRSLHSSRSNSPEPESPA